MAAVALLDGCGSTSRVGDSGSSSSAGLSDTYRFNIHASADVLDSVQSFVKFTPPSAYTLEAVVESSQPMLMLSLVDAAHDGSFSTLQKSYGQPEILHLDNNSDGHTYVRVNANNHENNIGLVETRIDLGETPYRKMGESNRTYNQIIACNGSSHNTLNEQQRFISQKMAVATLNTTAALEDTWRDIKVWESAAQAAMAHGKNFPLQLMYQYDEIEPLESTGNDAAEAPWQTIDLLDDLLNFWGNAEAAQAGRSHPFALLAESHFDFVQVHDLSHYTGHDGKQFLYGTVGINYLYSVGFIITFDGSSPDVHWYMSEELEYGSIDPVHEGNGLQYSTRYAYLCTRLLRTHGPLADDDIESVDDVVQDMADSRAQTVASAKEEFEKRFGPQLYHPVLMLDESVVMGYVSYVLRGDRYNNMYTEQAVYITLSTKPAGDYISSVEMQDTEKQTADKLTGWNSSGQYNHYECNGFSMREALYDVGGWDHFPYSLSVTDDTIIVNAVQKSISAGQVTRQAFHFTRYGERMKMDYLGGEVASIDQETATAWYVEKNIIPETDRSLTDYLGDDCAVEISKNHHGVVTLYLIPKDPGRLTFEWKINTDGAVPQPIAIGVTRVLPWSGYLHGSEILYVGSEQKNILPRADGALGSLTHQSGNDAQSYFHAFSDYLEHNWKLVELQGAPAVPPRQIASIHKVKQRIHQATLVLTDQNHNAVTLDDNLYVEIRAASGVTIQDVTDAGKIKKAHINRTTSYLARDDGLGQVKLQIDVGHEGDLIAGTELHYRIVDIGDQGLSALASKNPGSPEVVLHRSENMLTTQWGSFNISFALHERLSEMEVLQPTAPEGTPAIAQTYRDGIDDKYGDEKDRFIASTQSAYATVSSNTIPSNETGLAFLKLENEIYNPLYGVKILDGTVKNYGLNEVAGIFDIIDDAVNRMKNIINSAVRAVAEEIAQLKAQLNELIGDIADIVKDVTKAVSSVVNAIEAFCTSIIKGVIAFVKLIIDVLKGLFDFAMAFDVGAGLKQLLIDNFTEGGSGVFSVIQEDISGTSPRLLEAVKTHSKSLDGIASSVTTIAKTPRTISEDSIETKKTRHKDATHHNHVQNQLSLNIDFGSTDALSTFVASDTTGCDLGDDLKTLMKDLGASLAQVGSDIAKTDFSAIGQDLESMVKRLEYDMMTLAEDTFKCIIDQVLGTFTLALEDFLSLQLPDVLQSLLNTVIVPLFGLGSRRFTTVSDLLFFIFGFIINIVSAIGSGIMKIIAPDLDVNVSELLANRGKYVGKTAMICSRYQGLSGQDLTEESYEKDIVIGILLANFSIYFSITPMLILEKDAAKASSGLHGFLKKFEMGMLLIELIALVLKEIVLLTHTSDPHDKEGDTSVEEVVIALMFVIKLLHTIVPAKKGAEDIFLLLRIMGLMVAHGLDLFTKAKEQEVLPIVTSVLEIVKTLVDMAFELQVEEGPVDPGDVVGVIFLLEIVNTAISVTEVLHIKDAETA